MYFTFSMILSQSKKGQNINTFLLTINYLNNNKSLFKTGKLLKLYYPRQSSLKNFTFIILTVNYKTTIMKQHFTKANLDFTIFGRSKKALQLLNLPNVIALLFILSSQTLVAQDVEYDWAYQIGAASLAQDRAGAIHTDAAGNVYTTGSFLGPADFEPGAGVTNVSSSFFDAYLSKVDVAGNLVWATGFGGTNSDVGKAVYADNAGNVYVIGEFYNSGDFDPGTGVTTLTSNGFNDIFVAKFDANGDQLWVSSFGGSQFDFGYGIVADDLGNAYITGSFSGTVDFEPGSGVTNLTSIAQSDIFITKLNATGTLVWAKNIGSANSSEGRALAIDAAGSIYLTGNFGGTTDFDPGAGTTNLTSAGNNDVFVLKMNSGGDLTWAKNLGGSSPDQARALTVDAAGNCYVAGHFSGTADFDPGAGTENLTSNGGQDAFITKLTTNGDYVWAKNLGGVDDDQALSLSVDAAEYVYTTGFFFGTADFDPSAGTENLTSIGFQDAFVSKLDANGDFVFVKHIGGVSTVQGIGISADAFGNVYVTGDFNDTVDFNPGADVNTLMTNGSPDVFVLKLKCAPNNVTETVTACGSYEFDGVTYTSDNNTATKTLTNVHGCDSIVTLDLTIITVDVATTVSDDTITATTIGATYQWIDCSDNSLITGETNASYVATQTGDYAVIITEGSCVDTSACENITIIGINDIGLNANEHMYQVYPNPATDEVFIANYHAGIENVSVMDLTGRIIMSFKPMAEHIDISQLVNGMYLLQISAGANTTTQKLIKN